MCGVGGVSRKRWDWGGAGGWRQCKWLRDGKGEKKSHHERDKRHRREAEVPPGEPLAAPAVIVWTLEEDMDTCDQSKMVARASCPPPLGSPEAPA